MVKIEKFLLVIMLLILPLIVSSRGFCGWEGPKQIVSLKFGTEALEVGKEDNEPWTQYPEWTAMDDNGILLIGDQINGKVLIFNENGDSIGVIVPSYDTGDAHWPNKLYFVGDGRIVAESHDLEVFDLSGKLLKKINNSDLIEILYNEGFVLDVYDSENRTTEYIKYNLNGDLIRKVNKNYDTKTNNTYSYNICYRYDSFLEIDQKRINYEIPKNKKSIIKFSPCGKKISELIIPENVVFTEDSLDKTEEAYFFTHDIYRGPTLTHKGDIIAEHITLTTFTVNKWTWVDSPDDPKGGPDAPADLKVAPSIDGLSLAWTASPQDPGCVEGYEVERSSTASDRFSNITTTAPGVIKYNDTAAIIGSSYDYRIRAKSSCGSSPYTAVVSGKRL